jgi:hypothetical protein
MTTPTTTPPVKRDKLGRPNAGFFYATTGKVKEDLVRQEMLLPREDRDALQAIAEHQGVTKYELMRQFIAWGIETEKREQQQRKRQ